MTKEKHLDLIIRLLRQIEKNTRKKKRNSIPVTSNYDINKKDFERVYRADYPKKVTKWEGLNECIKQIKTPQDYGKWITAMRNYSEFCKQESTPGNFVPAPRDFVRFMKNEYWRDWINRTIDTVGKTDYSFLKEEK